MTTTSSLPRRLLTVLFACTLLLGVLQAATATPAEAATVVAPAKSGTGKRVVYSAPQQRVWLVRADNTVARSYLVSGHKGNTLPPAGTYQVRSRSVTTRSLDGKVTMKHMVRFHHAGRAWVGFHSIPRDRAGQPIQTTKQLGTPLSAGCIRQADDAARTLYDFAPVGTKVVVLR
ncbi:L,D-transpeptidase [Egicoccus sp. AB-alg6-2]|uniref:L,D-transpeptidase n=1 Tax=Egicoccus sp. AB-alg6-2 TaxID=3242692 RepID=UPI00359DCEAB